MELKEIEYKIRKSHGLEYFKVAPGVWGMKILFVNVYIIASGDEDGQNWFLVDAGLHGSSNKIRRFAEHLFGEGTKPAAILLTHGHFDHVGALDELLKIWDVPVYAHYLEMPYLCGRSSYPPADPTVGGGLVSLLSWMFPNRPKDLGNKISSLEKEGNIPGLPDWKFIHTPGHSPGQMAFFREDDRVLIAGDAFVTTKQESVLSVVMQKKELSGPPKYYTIDWVAAKDSVVRLAALTPEIAATGHGKPMHGDELRQGLTYLVHNFDTVAVPHYGRYVKEPARANKNGVQYIPKQPVNPTVISTAAAIIAGIAAAGILWSLKRRPAS